MTNKFANRSFQASTSTSGGEGGESSVDWKALNTHVAESVQEVLGCEQGSPAAAIGIISGIVDYGKHQDPVRIEKMEDADKATQEWMQRMLDNKKAKINDEGMFEFQAPPRQEIGFYVDFPAVTVDKGQFFGESKPAPYRVLLGGDFWRNPRDTSQGKIPAQLTKVEGYPNDKKVWVFGDKNRATKLAKSATTPDGKKLANLKDGFAQDRLLELIGCAVSFSVEVFLNDNGYLQEKVSNPTPLMAGIPFPEYDEELLFYVGMHDKENDLNQVKMLTKVVKDYMKEAQDYDKSTVKSIFEELEASKESSGVDDSSKEENTSQEKAPVKEEVKPEEKVESKVNNPMEPQIDFDDD